MAETLEKVLLGETTAEVVEKINTAIEQVNLNMDAIEDAGKVDEVQANGTNCVKDKIVNFVGEGATTVTANATNGEIKISSTDTKNTAGALSEASNKLYLIGAKEQKENPQTYSNGGAYSIAGVLFSAEKRVLNADDYASLKELIDALQGGMEYVGTCGPGGYPISVTTIETDLTTVQPGTGTNEDPWLLPIGKYNNGTVIGVGNTVKVTQKGYYALDGLANIFYAEEQDLLIYKSDALGWDLIPSGNDGNVYTTESFSTTPDGSTGYLILSNNDGTNPTRVGQSDYTITSAASDLDAKSAYKIPDVLAVSEYVESITKHMVTAEVTDSTTDTSGFTPKEILVAGTTSGEKKAASSGYTIASTDLSDSEKSVPTSAKVKEYVDAATKNIVTTASSTLTTDQIVLGGGNQTVKASTYMISGQGISNNSSSIVPTQSAVKTYVDATAQSVIKRITIDATTFDETEDMVGEDAYGNYVYSTKTVYPSYMPVAVYNSEGKLVVVDITWATDGNISIAVSTNEMWTSLKGGYMILNKVQ